ncbi:MAG TPA: HesA/MoeB/ThiF family protein [Methanocorpusculum sp.]|nr:HesA/MoeB/ThiF family protein [Methanocorpusculum sp.]
MPQNNDTYIRQIPLIGEAGQAALDRATVFIAGAGGLGSPVAFYLASAGIGTIRIADMDAVDISNLNRQILHAKNRIGENKAESAKKTIEAYNPSCTVETFTEKIDDTSVVRMIGNADLIIDCLDNFETRYVLNRAALSLNKPLLHGAVAGYNGQLTLVIPGKTPCLSCIFPHAETASSPAVLGAPCGIIGSMQALEAIRALTGNPTLAGKLLIYDGMANTLSTFDVKKSSRCPVCGEKTI